MALYSSSDALDPKGSGNIIQSALRPGSSNSSRVLYPSLEAVILVFSGSWGLSRPGASNGWQAAPHAGQGGM
jgi:hypothetical protein